MKRPLKQMLIYSGHLVGLLLPKRNHSSLFFFFPVYHVGGSQKVHSNILNCVMDQRPWVFFTKKSKDQELRPLFQESGARLFDISSLIANRFTFHICLGALSTWINGCSSAVAFGANSSFFYHLIPFLRSHVRRIDLMHSFGSGLEDRSLPVVSHLDNRVTINRMILHKIKEQYASHGISLKLLDRIALIENEVSVTDTCPNKQENSHVRALYVGRGSKEKRVHLIYRAALRCTEIGVPAKFSFVGDISEVIDVKDSTCCVFKGEITEPNHLDELYDEADVLILTSSREGFPLVIMEAMAHGVVPVTTSVGGIPAHIKHKVNGMLIPENDEDATVDSVVGILGELSSNRPLLRQLSRSAYEYAREHFCPSSFCAAYRQLILGCDEPAQRPDPL